MSYQTFVLGLRTMDAGRMGRYARARRSVAIAGFLLLEFSGCASGDVKAGLGPNEDAVSALVVDAVTPTIESGQLTNVRVRGLTVSGQTVPVQVNWSSSGGSLVPVSDSEAQFSASVPGTYRIQARTLAAPSLVDSTTVVVVAPTSPTVSVSLHPDSLSLYGGDSWQFVAIATRQDGSTFTPSVEWSATGGVISEDGLYTAGIIPGAYQVTALHVASSLVDSSVVLVSPPPPPGANPHEPPGMTIGFDEAFTSTPVGQSSSGWYVELGGANVAVVDDANAPVSGPKVLQLKFPKGFGGGVEPMVINWNESGHFPANTGTLYMRMRVKLDANWSDNGNDGTKFIWPRPMVENTAHFSPISRAKGGMTVGFNFQASYLNGADDDNEDRSPRSLGVWHDVEWLLYQGSSASANDGTVKVWVDGTLVVSESRKKFAKNGDQLGWKYVSIAPVFGYGTKPVPHDQYIWIDHWYASVK